MGSSSGTGAIPAWSGELPYQTDDGEQFSPLTLHETDTAVELLRENGLVLERFPRYGYERCIPTQEEVLALAEDAELSGRTTARRSTGFRAPGGRWCGPGTERSCSPAIRPGTGAPASCQTAWTPTLFCCSAPPPPPDPLSQHKKRTLRMERPFFAYAVRSHGGF